MKQLKRNIKKQAGFTMTEILIGVVVVAIVSAGIYAGFNSYLSSQRSSDLVSWVSQITNNVHNSYLKSQTGYSTIATDTTYLISEKVFPDTLTIDNTAGTVKAFGGDVTLAADSSTGGFTLTFATVPSDTCMNALKTMGSNGLLSIDVGGSNLWTTGSTWPAKSAIAGACGNGSGDVPMAFHAS